MIAAAAMHAVTEAIRRFDDLSQAIHRMANSPILRDGQLVPEMLVQWVAHAHECIELLALAINPAPVSEVERLKAEVAGLRAHLDAKTADHKHVSEQWDATSATLAAVCKALGCDVDSVQAQAAMFREKATTLLHERDAARAEVERLRAENIALASELVGSKVDRDRAGAAHVRLVEALHGCQSERDELLAAVMDGTAQFREWQACIADNIEGQEAEVALDHNRMLAALHTLRRKAEHAQNETRRVIEAGSLPAHLERADLDAARDELEQLRTRAEAAEQELAELRQPAKPDRAASDAEGDGA